MYYFTGYKNQLWETVISIIIEKVSVIRTYFSTPTDVLITGIHFYMTNFLSD